MLKTREQAKREAQEPFGRGYTLAPFRPVALELWGPTGLTDIARRLAADVRRDTIDRPIDPAAWLPDRYTLAWFEAVWEGPAAERQEDMFRFLHRTIELGFGTVRKLLLYALPPAVILRKTEQIWDSSHTAGELRVTPRGPKAATLTCLDHATNGSHVGRVCAAESYRYALSLARTSSVTVSHELKEDGAVDVHLAWT